MQNIDIPDSESCPCNNCAILRGADIDYHMAKISDSMGEISYDYMILKKFNYDEWVKLTFAVGDLENYIKKVKSVGCQTKKNELT